MEFICDLFLMFILYSIIGYIVETIDMAVEYKKFSLHRGFLSGPLIPIFGAGATIISLLLSDFHNNIWVIFGLSILLCGVLEFYVSYFMEKFFNIRWWDYSKSKYNLDGRIELKNCVLFGFAGVIIIEVLNPFFTSLINSVPNRIIYIITIIIFILMIIDFTISTIAAYHLKKDIVPLLDGDNTDSHNKEIQKVIKGASKRIKNLINAFPHLQLQIFNKNKTTDK